MKLKLIVYGFSIGAITSEWVQMLLDAKHQFFAIMFVVFLDAFFGILKSFKVENFETNLALKSLFKLVGYWLLLATVLTIEKGFPIASFLSESILLPILLIQLVSILKNMKLIGLITNTMLSKILSKIDKHKDIEL